MHNEEDGTLEPPHLKLFIIYLSLILVIIVLALHNLMYHEEINYDDAVKYAYVEKMKETKAIVL